MIEIKCAATKDRMRKDQHKERKRVEAAGGTYIKVTDNAALCGMV